jgi:hypothetical protein
MIRLELLQFGWIHNELQSLDREDGARGKHVRVARNKFVHGLCIWNTHAPAQFLSKHLHQEQFLLLPPARDKFGIFVEVFLASGLREQPSVNYSLKSRLLRSFSFGPGRKGDTGKFTINLLQRHLVVVHDCCDLPGCLSLAGTSAYCQQSYTAKDH